MTRINRRQFGLASAVSAIAVTRGVHSFAQAQEAASPSERLGVAICGVNGRGGEHIRGFHKDPRSEIRVIVDVDEKVAQSKADSIAKMQGTRPVIVTDYRRALDMEGVDILTAATPNHWHALMGVTAMAAGKDVYIEKPISHNIHEGRALVAAMAQYKRMFQTGTQCRSSTGIIPAMKFIAEGGIGECNFARGLCYKRRPSIGKLGDYAVPKGVDFNLWSGPASYTDPKVTRPKFHYDWHWQRHYGNGDSGNQGPHQTDIARWGLGLDRHPHSIISYGGRLGYQAERKDPNYVDAGDTANTQVSIYDYGDKCIVFETRGLSVDDSADTEINALFGSTKGNKIGVIFYGSEGYVVQTQYDECIVYDMDKKEVKKFRANSNVGDDHFVNFLDCVQSRDASKLNADARCGHLSAAIAHLGNTSYYCGGNETISVDSLKESIAGIKSLDDNAATLDRTLKHLSDNGVELKDAPLVLGPMLKFDPEAEIYLDNELASTMLTRDYRPEFEVPSAEKILGRQVEVAAR